MNEYWQKTENNHEGLDFRISHLIGLIYLRVTSWKLLFSTNKIKPPRLIRDKQN